MIAFVFPFLSFSPWQMRSTPKMFGVARKLRHMFQEEKVAGGDILRKFLLEIRSFRTLPPDVVRSMLYFTPKTEVPYQDAARGPTISNRPKRQRDREVAFGLGEEASIQRRFQSG